MTFFFYFETFPFTLIFFFIVLSCMLVQLSLYISISIYQLKKNNLGIMFE